MKALLFVLIASLFATDFQDFEEDEIKLGGLIKKAIPIVKKVAPLFLAEEEEQLVMNMTNPFAPKAKPVLNKTRPPVKPINKTRPHPKPINGTKPQPKPHPKPQPKPHPKPINKTRPHPKPQPKPHPKPQPKPINKTRPHPKPINGTKPHPKPQPKPQPKPINKTRPHPKPINKTRPTPKAMIDTVENDEFNLGGLIKKAIPIIKTVAPLFLAEEDEFNLGGLIKKVIPIVKTVAPLFLAEDDDEVDESFWGSVWGAVKTYGPTVIKTVLPLFLSEEDAAFDVEEFETLLLVTVAVDLEQQGYILDEGWLSKIGAYLKPRIPNIVRTLVPMIPKVGPKIMPIIEPFLAEQEDQFNLGGFIKKAIPVVKTIAPLFLAEEDEFNLGGLIKKAIPIIKTVAPLFLADEEDEFNLGGLIKKAIPIVKTIAPLFLAEEDDEVDESFWGTVVGAVKKYGPTIIKTVVPLFLSEEDAEFDIEEFETLLLVTVAIDLEEQGYVLDEGWLKKVGAYLKPRIPNIIRTLVPMIPKIGPKIAPIIEPFLAEQEDQFNLGGFIKKAIPVVKTIAPLFLAEEDSLSLCKCIRAPCPC